MLLQVISPKTKDLWFNNASALLLNSKTMHIRAMLGFRGAEFQTLEHNRVRLDGPTAKTSRVKPW